MSTKPLTRLGRGLSSLIGSTTTAAAAELPGGQSAVPAAKPLSPGLDARIVPISSIDPNPNQPRRRFDTERLQRLADSLAANGTLQPILLRQKGDRYELLAGERRWRASKLAGLATIPAIIRTADDTTALQLALIENVQREDLNAVERAKAYAELASRHGMSHDAIGKHMGEDRATVSNYIRILDLDDEILELVATGSLSMGHARSILGLAKPAERLHLARRIVDESMSVRQAEVLVQQARQPGAAKATPAKPSPRAVISDLETRLLAALGLRVRIVESRRKHRGRVIIDYHSLDDFEAILRRLGITDVT